MLCGARVQRYGRYGRRLRYVGVNSGLWVPNVMVTSIDVLIVKIGPPFFAQLTAEIPCLYYY